MLGLGSSFDFAQDINVFQVVPLDLWRQLPKYYKLRRQNAFPPYPHLKTYGEKDPRIGDSLFFYQPISIYLPFPHSVFLPMIFSVYTKQIPRLVEIGWSLHGSYSPLWFHKSLNLKQYNFYLIESLISCCLSCLYSTTYLEAEASVFHLNQFPVDFVSVRTSCLLLRTVLLWCSFPGASVEETGVNMMTTSAGFSPQVMSCHPERLHCGAAGQLLASFMKGSLLPLVSWYNASYSGPKQK